MEREGKTGGNQCEKRRREREREREMEGKTERERERWRERESERDREINHNTQYCVNITYSSTVYLPVVLLSYQQE